MIFWHRTIKGNQKELTMTLLTADTELLQLSPSSPQNFTISQRKSVWTTQKIVALIVGLATLIVVGIFLIITFSYLSFLAHEAFTLPPVTNTVQTQTVQTPAGVTKLQTLLTAKETQLQQLVSNTTNTLQSPAAKADAAQAKATLEAGITKIKAEIQTLTQQH